MNLAKSVDPLPASNRHIGFDCVRVAAAIMVVYLHACVPYLVHPMPGLVWTVVDQPSVVCDLLFWAIEIVVMPMFLVVSGFFTYQAYQRSNGLAFIRSRSRRLLRPLAFAMVILLPIDLYVWMLGLIASGHMTMAKLKSLKVPPPFGDHLWGTSHLWFLVYVFSYATVFAIVAMWVRRPIAMKWRMVARRASITAVAGIGVSVLFLRPEVVFGFQHSFFPVPSKWIYSGSFFAGGVVLAVFDANLRTIDRFAFRHVSLGACLIVASVMLGRWTIASSADRDASTAGTSFVPIALATMTTGAAWLVTLGFLGVANRLRESISSRPLLDRSIGYLAAASFWIYLVHHPVIGLVHIDLAFWAPQLGPMTKSLVALGATLTWSLASYHWLIRGTAMGRWIGVDSSVVPSTAMPNEPIEEQGRRAAA